MSKLLVFMIAFAITISSVMATELPESIFGTTKYDGKKREVALLLNKISGEKDSYYAVVYEYLSYMREDNFMADFFRPGKKKLFSKKKNGYLQELLQWIKIYKMIKVEGTNTYKFQKLKVENGEISSIELSDNSLLTLSDKKNPLKGATLITTVDGKEIELNLKRNSRFPLKSSWEKKYVPGPYNPGYKQADIKILDLVRDYNSDLKEASAIFDVKKLKGKEITIKGEFKIKEAYKGMFTFVDKQTATTYGADKIESKIGVFIDVYNAQPVMNTVELILVDTQDEKNSQMYFEEYGNEDK